MAKYHKPMALANARNSSSELTRAVDKHPNKDIFFVGKLFDQYYHPMATDHESVHAARVHAVVATAAHMDYGLCAIYLGRAAA